MINSTLQIKSTYPVMGGVRKGYSFDFEIRCELLIHYFDKNSLTSNYY